MYLLDTNVVSELRRPDKADPRVRDWAARIPVSELYLSVITIFEIELGIRQVERRDTDQAVHLRAWLENQIVPRFDERIVPIDTAIAQRCAELHVPDPRADRDAFIAATALVHGMTVVTRNVADFEATGAPLVNPWVVGPH